mmetsp:Transcript_52706/g.125510  ORF Transcript_52706/g.125510 Transcript_52706/m.125510 type:complete len:237 (+) Transcript_52706:553-1263(+)
MGARRGKRHTSLCSVPRGFEGASLQHHHWRNPEVPNQHVGSGERHLQRRRGRGGQKGGDPRTQPHWGPGTRHGRQGWIYDRGPGWGGLPRVFAPPGALQVPSQQATVQHLEHARGGAVARAGRGTHARLRTQAQKGAPYAASGGVPMADTQASVRPRDDPIVRRVLLQERIRGRGQRVPLPRGPRGVLQAAGLLLRIVPGLTPRETQDRPHPPQPDASLDGGAVHGDPQRGLLAPL